MRVFRVVGDDTPLGFVDDLPGDRVRLRRVDVVAHGAALEVRPTHDASTFEFA